MYDIYSGSKPITMAGVMQLVEQGKLGLDDRLDKYFPEFAHMRYAPDFKFAFPLTWPNESFRLLDATRPMVIHDLMSMTSGMSYDLDAAPIREVIERTNGEAGTKELVFTPAPRTTITGNTCLRRSRAATSWSTRTATTPFPTRRG